eukprot:Clim_evm29s191 gene=Clim_evmTU29s191
MPGAYGPRHWYVKPKEKSTTSRRPNPKGKEPVKVLFNQERSAATTALERRKQRLADIRKKRSFRKPPKGLTGAGIPIEQFKEIREAERATKLAHSLKEHSPIPAASVPVTEGLEKIVEYVEQREAEEDSLQMKGIKSVYDADFSPPRGHRDYERLQSVPAAGSPSKQTHTMGPNATGVKLSPTKKTTGATDHIHRLGDYLMGKLGMPPTYPHVVPVDNIRRIGDYIFGSNGRPIAGPKGALDVSSGLEGAYPQPRPAGKASLYYQRTPDRSLRGNESYSADVPTHERAKESGTHTPRGQASRRLDFGQASQHTQWPESPKVKPTSHKHKTQQQGAYDDFLPNEHTLEQFDEYESVYQHDFQSFNALEEQAQREPHEPEYHYIPPVPTFTSEYQKKYSSPEHDRKVREAVDMLQSLEDRQEHIKQRAQMRSKKAAQEELKAKQNTVEAESSAQAAQRSAAIQAHEKFKSIPVPPFVLFEDGGPAQTEYRRMFTPLSKRNPQPPPTEETNRAMKYSEEQKETHADWLQQVRELRAKARAYKERAKGDAMQKELEDIQNLAAPFGQTKSSVRITGRAPESRLHFEPDSIEIDDGTGRYGHREVQVDHGAPAASTQTPRREYEDASHQIGMYVEEPLEAEQPAFVQEVDEVYEGEEYDAGHPVEIDSVPCEENIDDEGYDFGYEDVTDFEARDEYVEYDSPGPDIEYLDEEEVQIDYLPTTGTNVSMGKSYEVPRGEAEGVDAGVGYDEEDFEVAEHDVLAYDEQDLEDAIAREVAEDVAAAHLAEEPEDDGYQGDDEIGASHVDIAGSANMPPPSLPENTAHTAHQTLQRAKNRRKRQWS